MIAARNTMDDFVIEVHQVPEGKALTGFEVYEPGVESRVVQIRKRWEPTYAYCPECTNTTEYDSRWKEHRQRRMGAEDYRQRFKQKECADSPTGWTNQCLNCGFELKDTSVEEAEKEEDRGEDAEIEWMNTGYMYEGGWWLTIDKIKEMLKIGNGSIVEMNFAFVIEGQTRMLPYSKLREVVKTKTILNREGSNDTGFPIHIFRTL